jgi:putative tryptophan/tyrosine transport system substrate-binding protein
MATHIRRREFMVALGGAVATCPLGARAQQADRMRRVGLLMGYPEGDPEGQANLTAFRQGLQKLGWTEGRNIRIDIRWGGADPNKARTFAKELVSMAPDVIVPNTNLMTAILQPETHTIPIVFVFVGDPVGSGYVASLARPGGNITGFSALDPAIGGKWLEILKEMAPHVTRVAVILHPETPPNVGFWRAAEAGAPSLGVKVTALGVHNTAEIEGRMTEFAAESNGGLIIAPHAVTLTYRNVIIGLAARYRLPAVYGFRIFATSGGLISYGTSPLEQFRRGASYVDRILKGEKPGDLPVQNPTKYELVINLKTAKALGLDVPLNLQQLADEVIE